MKSLFTDKNCNRLVFFDNSIVINEFLPKWKLAKKIVEEKQKKKNKEKDDVSEVYTQTYNNIISSTNSTGSNMFLYDTPNYITPTIVGNNYNVEDINLDDLAKAEIEELNTIIQETPKIKNILGGYMVNSLGTPIPIQAASSFYTGKKEQSLFYKIVSFFTKKKEEKFEFDAFKFFENVKLSSKEGTEYVERVRKYVKSIRRANEIGQTALKEKLFKGMLTNKYENVLHAKGYLYAITEEQLITFLKKTEKGVNITYIKNFTRPIPEEVMNKIEEVNKLNVFDNYVIIHYDPEKLAIKETETEKAKRKDPILCGVIACAASTDDPRTNKLYYITDWVDEYCDLTLDKFVDTINIKKEEIEI